MNRHFKPSDVYNALDKSVSGQHDAKITLSNLCYQGLLKFDAYLHFGYDQLEKFCPLFIGSTGVGKTYLINRLKDFLGTNVYIYDCSAISATGYMQNGGKNLKQILETYIERAGEIVENKILNEDTRENLLADEVVDYFQVLFIEEIMKGILVFDEFDKISAMNDGSSQAKYNYEIQDNFLKLVEGEEIEVDMYKLAPDLRVRHNFKINTSMIQMVFMGAFSDLQKHRQDTASKNSIGFSNSVKENKTKIDKYVLSDWGFKEELLGRLSSVVLLDSLTNTDLRNILLNVNNCLFNQYKSIFELQGKEVVLSENLINESINSSIKSGLGARALKEFYISRMQNILFKLPDSTRHFNTLDIKGDEIIIKEDEEEDENLTK
jgi:ATP-dependent Clp protease ATP-binding subunit ClpX